MKIVRSILSLAFAFLVMVSSTSFMVGIHHCGGHVKSMALFTRAEACANEQKLPPCHRIDAQACCQDVTVVHEQQDFKGDVAQYEFSPSLIGDAVQPEVVLAEVIPAVADRAYDNVYHPPLLASDLTVTFQVFLI